jgi:hypothetical protein
MLEAHIQYLKVHTDNLRIYLLKYITLPKFSNLILMGAYFLTSMDIYILNL